MKPSHFRPSETPRATVCVWTAKHRVSTVTFLIIVLIYFLIYFHNSSFIVVILISQHPSFRHADPTWASLNLGALICIECSGIHRNLGTHLSRVRSLDLDDWPGELTQVLAAIGNHMANSIWESCTQGRTKPTPHATRWVPHPNPLVLFMLLCGPPAGHTPPCLFFTHTRSKSSVFLCVSVFDSEERESWIRAKYEQRAFVAPLQPASGTGLHDDSMSVWVLSAVTDRDLPRLLLLLAHSNKEQINSQPAGSTSLSRTALHAACQLGDVVMTQLLVWVGSPQLSTQTHSGHM